MRAAGREPRLDGVVGATWSRLEGRLAQLRRLGVRGVLEIEQDVLRRLLKTTLAATVAWAAADLLDSPRPALASLAAILVVQVTVRATLARSIQLTIGVTLGLIIAVGLGPLLGSHWWTVGLLVLGGWSSARSCASDRSCRRPPSAPCSPSAWAAGTD